MTGLTGDVRDLMLRSHGSLTEEGYLADIDEDLSETDWPADPFKKCCMALSPNIDAVSGVPDMCKALHHELQKLSLNPSQSHFSFRQALTMGLLAIARLRWAAARNELNMAKRAALLHSAVIGFFHAGQVADHTWEALTQQVGIDWDGLIRYGSLVSEAFLKNLPHSEPNYYTLWTREWEAQVLSSRRWTGLEFVYKVIKTLGLTFSSLPDFPITRYIRGDGLGRRSKVSLQRRVQFKGRRVAALAA